MKKEVIVLLLLGILLFSPLVLAQEQAQTYSGFGRFIDNVKMFFASGDNKVSVALEIREKELNSAIENNKNGEDGETDKSLEHAWRKLQLVQKRVSSGTAEEVKNSVEGSINKINDEGSLSDNFELYALEEEKTGLKAEWVIEIEGKEGQTLTNDVVEAGSEGQTKVREIETRMGEVDNEIKNWVVDNFEGSEEGDNGLTWEVANKIAEEDHDDNLTREIKTYVSKDECGDNGDHGDDLDVVDEDENPSESGTVGDVDDD